MGWASRSRGRILLAGVAAGFVTSSPWIAQAASSSSRELTREEIEAFLDSRALPRGSNEAVGDRPTAEEAPPPPPRHRGWVVETSVGAVFQLGALRHVSPPSPWLQAVFGYEMADWVMFLVEGDFTIANTSFARPPPPPRTYAQYAFGGGVRFQFDLAERFTTHLQPEFGLSEVTSDVLEVYGYQNTDELNLYYGARLGLEWHAKNPHVSVTASGTFRNYEALTRENSEDPPFAVIAGLGLRYAF